MVSQSRYLILNAFKTQKTVSIIDLGRAVFVADPGISRERDVFTLFSEMFLLAYFRLLFMLDITAIVEHKNIPKEET